LPSPGNPLDPALRQAAAPPRTIQSGTTAGSRCCRSTIATALMMAYLTLVEATIRTCSPRRPAPTGARTDISPQGVACGAAPPGSPPDASRAPAKPVDDSHATPPISHPPPNVRPGRSPPPVQASRSTCSWCLAVGLGHADGQRQAVGQRPVRGSRRSTFQVNPRDVTYQRLCGPRVRPGDTSHKEEFESPLIGRVGWCGSTDPRISVFASSC
jgi:hypothetical protein